MIVSLICAAALLSTGTSAMFLQDKRVSISVPNQGTVTGTVNDKTRVFLGVPYAQPPVGPLRFKQAVPHGSTNLTIDATQPGVTCIQKGNSDAKKVGEDCLNLDIYSPVGASNLPVMVYIFGGGFETGHSNQGGFYNGANIINRFPDVVIVSINYRLGPFGWLASRELQSEGSINVGLLDQAEAFRWVRKNIAAFGGDPRRVTAFGQSAGAISIAAHLMANGGNQTLFDRAILMSGASGFQRNDPIGKQGEFDAVAKEVGCTPGNGNVMDCMRSVSSDALKAATEKLSDAKVINYGLTFDGSYVRQTVETYKTGAFSKIPVLINTNVLEGEVQSGYLEGGPSITTKEEYLSRQKRRTAQLLRDDAGAQQLASFYDVSKYNNKFDDAFSDFYADWAFKCPASLMAQQYAKAGAKVYVSRFKPALQLTRLLGKKASFHGGDVPVVWQYRLFLTPFEYNLANRVTQSYISFAQGKEPLPEWKEYGSQASRFDIAGQKMEQDDDLNKDKCQFLINSSSQFYGFGPFY